MDLALVVQVRQCSTEEPACHSGFVLPGQLDVIRCGHLKVLLELPDVREEDFILLQLPAGIRDQKDELQLGPLHGALIKLGRADSVLSGGKINYGKGNGKDMPWPITCWHVMSWPITDISIWRYGPIHAGNWQTSLAWQAHGTGRLSPAALQTCALNDDCNNCSNVVTMNIHNHCCKRLLLQSTITVLGGSDEGKEPS